MLRRRPGAIERTLALSIAGLMLFAITNAYPFLGFEIQGTTVHTTLFEAVQLLHEGGNWLVAGVVLITAILAPLLQLLATLSVSLPLYFNRPWDLGRLFRIIQHIRPWSMLEVFLLGILVTVVKLAKMATIIPGPALWSFFALIVVVAAATSALDPVEVWRRLDERHR
jgi:paraquat-inducible protein A